jgi:hypothetical protein
MSVDSGGGDDNGSVKFSESNDSDVDCAQEENWN